MRLANLRNIKFSNFSFYQYFFTVYIGLHVTFSVLLGNITAFAPDEGLYKDIFSRLYTSDFTSDVLGFSGAWEPWLRLFYLPAKLLTYLGFTDLLAVRFLAIGYSTLATFFGATTSPTHRALDDARATVDVLHGIFERLGSFEVSTLQGLLDFKRKRAKRPLD